jgi:hypothetical protein
MISSQLAKADLPVIYRLRQPNDDSFIYAAWTNLYRSQPANRLVPTEAFYQEYNKFIYSILQSANVMVAQLDPTPEEPNTLLSYLVYQYQDHHLLLHFAFTKPDFRRLGILTNLLKIVNIYQQPLIVTCQPEIAVFKHMQSKDVSMLYDPFYFSRSFFHAQNPIS